MTTIYLMRHGESTSNVTHIASGKLNVALTLNGMDQAKKAAAYLADKNIQRIYVSDLVRTHMTAQPTAELLGLEMETELGISEINLGHWEGLLVKDIEVLFPEEMKAWIEKVEDARRKGGETLNEVKLRMKNAMTKIAEDNPSKTILVTSHAIAIACFICHVLGITFPEYNRMFPLMKNTTIFILTYENGRFTLQNKGTCQHLDEADANAAQI